MDGCKTRETSHNIEEMLQKFRVEDLEFRVPRLTPLEDVKTSVVLRKVARTKEF